MYRRSACAHSCCAPVRCALLTRVALLCLLRMTREKLMEPEASSERGCPPTYALLAAGRRLLAVTLEQCACVRRLPDLEGRAAARDHVPEAAGLQVHAPELPVPALAQRARLPRLHLLGRALRALRSSSSSSSSSSSLSLSLSHSLPSPPLTSPHLSSSSFQLTAPPRRYATCLTRRPHPPRTSDSLARPHHYPQRLTRIA